MKRREGLREYQLSFEYILWLWMIEKQTGHIMEHLHGIPTPFSEKADGDYQQRRTGENEQSSG